MSSVKKSVFCRAIVSVSMLLTMFAGNATEYTSIGSGEWSDITIWSTDGGLTACSCAPLYSFASDTVYIYDTVSYTSNITINADPGYIHVYTGAQFLGILNDISLTRGTFTADTNTLVEAFQITVSNTSTLNADGDMTINKKLTVHGIMNLTGKVVIQTDKANFMSTSTVNIIGGEVIVETKDIVIDGVVNLTNGCLVTTIGLITNKATGTVNGTGAASSGGDINNSSTWSVNVKWCAAGLDSGMPTPEDCSFDCIIVLLPIELSFFDAFQEEDFIRVQWTTSLEINNDYFIVERSVDGINYEQICSEKGAGNSIEELQYSCNDFEPVSGVAYYRIRQYDYDGAFSLSHSVSVHFQSASQLLLNILDDRIIIRGMDEIESEEVHISLMDMFGKNLTSIDYRRAATSSTVELMLPAAYSENQMLLLSLREMDSGVNRIYRLITGEMYKPAGFMMFRF